MTNKGYGILVHACCIPVTSATVETLFSHEELLMRLQGVSYNNGTQPAVFRVTSR